jgi:hypothetical protein
MNYTIVFMVTAACIVMPLIIGFVSYQEKKLKLKREIALAGGADLRRELAQSQEVVERLRERVAVLERLVTSEDRRIGEEIDRLSRPPGANVGRI